MRLFIQLIAPPHKCTFNDMLNQVFSTRQKIQAASTMCMLPLLANKIDQIAAYYSRIPQTAYWANDLQHSLLLKHCELLAAQYPETEEA